METCKAGATSALAFKMSSAWTATVEVACDSAERNDLGGASLAMVEMPPSLLAMII